MKYYVKTNEDNMVIATINEPKDGYQERDCYFEDDYVIDKDNPVYYDDGKTVRVLESTRLLVVKQNKKAEADYKCREYIVSTIGDLEHQNKYIAEFNSYTDKLLLHIADSNNPPLTTEEEIRREELRDMHRLYKAILTEYALNIELIDAFTTIEEVNNFVIDYSD